MKYSQKYNEIMKAVYCIHGFMFEKYNLLLLMVIQTFLQMSVKTIFIVVLLVLLIKCVLYYSLHVSNAK